MLNHLPASSWVGTVAVAAGKGKTRTHVISLPYALSKRAANRYTKSLASVDARYKGVKVVMVKTAQALAA